MTVHRHPLGRFGSTKASFLPTLLLCSLFTVAAQTAAAQAVCPFNVSGGSNPRLTVDGVLLSRYAMASRGTALTRGVLPVGSDVAGIESTILGYAATRLDVDGDGVFTSNDALIVARYLAGYSKERWLTGITLASNAGRAHVDDIASFIALGCPAPAVAAQNDAARLLTQATFGPTLAAITALQTKTAAQWVEEQFALAMHTPSHWNYVATGGPTGQSRYINAMMESFWLQAVRSPDQLRQRTAFALSQIFVVSAVNSAVDIQPDAHASYLDMLGRNAFGNFRTLLEDVTLHPTMAVYLSWMKNDKEVPGGRQPDENYAREVMQLFSVGLWQLNSDGTRKIGIDGKHIPTYGQEDIKGMARVLTGWGWGQRPGPDFDPTNFEYTANSIWDLPMRLYPAHHSASEKRIINNVVIPPNTDGIDSMRIALDTLFNHPNVGPFIGSQLIKRFVTSNPSRAYVQRVTEAFNNNGNNVRGDMKAVVRAVLLDAEARDATVAAGANFGKLREPMIRYANFMRAFDVKAAPINYYPIWNLEDPVSSLGQNPLRAPSVFNWYRPDYAPPGAIVSQGLVAPEFQITHETTLTGYTNFITDKAERETDKYRAIFGAPPDYLAADVSAELALAATPDALIDRLNLLLLYGKITPTLRATVRDAINAISGDASARVATATALIMSSPQYVVQK